MKKSLLWILVLSFLLLFAEPLSAAPVQEAERKGDTFTNQGEQFVLEEKESLTLEELHQKVEEQRDKLLENRLEVVKQANDAKARLEEQMAGATDAKSQDKLAESLKKDLETIKEANKALNTILSDILTATSVKGVQEEAPAAAEQELPQDRKYLHQLAILYQEKSQQLEAVIESLAEVGQERAD